jgi:preprotein translocase subunit SecD
VIEEERTVGPGLGQDSIESGALACVVGLILVLIAVASYYRLAGVYASFALLANLVFLIGLMSLFEATLTLPGIAGLVLTVGMAVDANVIIFERIREELRAGRAVKTAIATGFSKATWTVLDANITTLITAIILFQWGTGPIKGFAVTLSIGIVTSVFAALVLTRLLFQIYPGTRNVSALSI